MKKFMISFLPTFFAFGLWISANAFLTSVPVKAQELINNFKFCVQKWDKSYVAGFCEAQTFAHCGLASSPLVVTTNSKCDYVFSISSQCFDKNPDYHVPELTYEANCVQTAGGACTVDHSGSTISWQLKSSDTVKGYTCTGTNGGGDTSLPKYCPTCP